MDKCKTCAKYFEWNGCKYCEDTNEWPPIDDIDCDFVEDKALFDVQTGLERNATPCKDS
jgi:hypothetical protein